MKGGSNLHGYVSMMTCEKENFVLVEKQWQCNVVQWRCQKENSNCVTKKNIRVLLNNITMLQGVI